MPLFAIGDRVDTKAKREDGISRIGTVIDVIPYNGSMRTNRESLDEIVIKHDHFEGPWSWYARGLEFAPNQPPNDGRTICPQCFTLALFHPNGTPAEPHVCAPRPGFGLKEAP